MNIKTVVVLGKFDGVHIGHQKLLKSAVSIAKERGLKTLVFEILPFNTSKNITTEAKKEEIIKSLGIDEVVRQYLSDDFKSLTPSKFVSCVLKDKLNAECVVVGRNYRFGKDRAGDVETLTSLCNDEKIDVTVVESVMTENEDGKVERVSSSRIRNLIESGKTEETKKCLGRYFCMWGKVTEGKHLGRKIGFPTVNFYPDENELVPKYGVYATNVFIDNKKYLGITNVGINPTVENGKNIKVETFIFDYNGNAYGSIVRIKFLEFVRDEIKFKDIEELKTQIEKDKKCVMDKEWSE